MIRFGAIVKSLARRVEAALRALDARLGLAADLLLGRRPRPIPVPIPARRSRCIR